jgi:hypothetical protein
MPRPVQQAGLVRCTATTLPRLASALWDSSPPAIASTGITGGATERPGSALPPC